MKRLLELAIALAIVASIFLIVGVLLPSKRHLQETVETNRRIGVVYDTLNSFRRWGEWNTVTLRDPNATLTRSGPDEGVGAKLQYASQVDTVGNGSWEIIETNPNESIVYALQTPNRGSNKRSTIRLQVAGSNMRSVEIQQSYSVDYGWDLFGRYAGLYLSGNVGEDMKIGLERLSTLLASVPNIDYNEMDPTTFKGLAVVDLPAQNLLVVNAGAVSRKNEELIKGMKNQQEWINRVMATNNLEAAGPLRIRTLELGRENWAFEVIQPVRRKGAAADAEAAELTGLDLMGETVKYERSAARKVATAEMMGSWIQLENGRNALRAWAMTQGHEITGRAYEDFNNGIDAAFGSEGSYRLYWDLQTDANSQ